MLNILSIQIYACIIEFPRVYGANNEIRSLNEKQTIKYISINRVWLQL